MPDHLDGVNRGPSGVSQTDRSVRLAARRLWAWVLALAGAGLGVLCIVLAVGVLREGEVLVRAYHPDLPLRVHAVGLAAWAWGLAVLWFGVTLIGWPLCDLFEPTRRHAAAIRSVLTTPTLLLFVAAVALYVAGRLGYWVM